MKSLIIFSLLFSWCAFAENPESNKNLEKIQEKMDYGDKQLLQRDICRKPSEYLETRYGMTKEDVAKAKAKCPY